MKATLTIVMTGCLAIALAAAQSRPAADRYQEALRLEEIKGDLKGAIEHYKKLAQDADRAIAAKALVQLAGCYEKLGQSDARRTYERVVSDFKDQPESVALARTALAVLQSVGAIPAGPVFRQIWNDVDESESGPIGVSADGRYLSFTDGTSLDLIVRDLRTGMNRPVTNVKRSASGAADYATESLVSPDGRFVAYTWELPGAYELRILPINGQRGEPRVVHQSKDTNYIWPAGWSPDGKSLLVGRELQDSTWQIAVVTVADGSIRVVKQLNQHQPLKLSWAPDGQWIAYDHPGALDTNTRDVFLLGADGSRETIVALSPAEDRWPVWSPDGSQLLFVSDRSGNTALWSIRVEGGRANGVPELVKVKTDMGYPLGITKTGALHYIMRDQTNRIYNVDVDANMKVTGAPVLATDRFVNSSVSPAVSPDGQSLAFVSVRGVAPSDNPTSVIVVRSLATGEERDLRSIAPSTRGRERLRWFPDGRSLLVRSQPDRRTNRIGFYRVFTSGAKAELLFERGNESGVSDLSPDGRSIFYVDRSQAPGKLVRFDLDSRRASVVSSAPLGGNNILQIAVSPDGAQLALVGSRGWVGVMPVHGGEPRPVGGGISDLAWTRDARHLLVVCGTDRSARAATPTESQLCLIPAAGGDSEKIGLKGMIVFPQLDPHSQRITYQVNDASASTLWVLENFLPTTAPMAIKAGGSR